MFWAASLDLLRRADPRPGERLLDVACGTGVVARVAASAYAAVATGVDKSRKFLRQAASSPEGGDLRWVLGDAVALPFASGSFDVAICQQGLQFFEAPARALSEMHRVLAAGGVAVVSSWASLERAPGFAALAEALGEHVGPHARQMLRGGPWRLGDALPIEQAMRRAGFTAVEVETQRVEAVFSSAPAFVAQYLSCIGLQWIVFDPAGVFDVLVADVEASCPSDGRASGFVFPSETWVFAADKGRAERTSSTRLKPLEFPGTPLSQPTAATERLA
jgi:ubiquinone/menaquinone biosynthesis C-methylase UbiE